MWSRGDGPPLLMQIRRRNNSHGRAQSTPQHDLQEYGSNPNHCSRQPLSMQNKAKKLNIRIILGETALNGISYLIFRWPRLHRLHSRSLSSFTEHHPLHFGMHFQCKLIQTNSNNSECVKTNSLNVWPPLPAVSGSDEELSDLHLNTWMEDKS